MGINLSKGQRVNLGKTMTLALVGLGWIQINMMVAMILT